MKTTADFYLELRRAWFYGQATVEKVIADHEATIRAECADRAVLWCKKWAVFPMGNHGTSALKAAIEGGQA